MRPATMLLALLLLTAGLQICGGASAQGTDKWRWQGGTYLWLPNMGGDLTASGGSLPFTMDVDDLLDNGKGLNLHVEAFRGKQGFFFDGSYLDYDDSGMVTPSGSSTPVEVSAELKQQIYEFGWMHDLWQKQLKPDNPAAVLDVKGYVGARYTDISLDMSVPSASVRDKRSDSWLEPFIGLQALMPVAQRVAVRLKGDYGGFGIGTASDSTYKLRISGLYLINQTYLAELGWQWMGVENDDLGTAGTTEIDYTANGVFFSLIRNF